MMAYGREGLKPEHTKRRMVKDPDEDLEVDRFEEGNGSIYIKRCAKRDINF